METCDCNNLTLGNTGRTDCDSIPSVMQGGFFMFTFDSDGNKNKIDLTDTIDDAYISALVNQADATKRWYPTGTLENIGGERAEAVFAEASSGRKVRLRDGIRNVTAEMWEEGSSLLQEWEKAGCPQVSYFFVDDEGKLVGMVVNPEDGFLYPIKVQKNTFSPTLVLATEDEPSKIMLSFDFDSNEQDSLIRAIAAADMSADLLEVNGLFGVTSTYATISTTGFVATLELKYGSIKNKIKNGGLLIGDFTLYNETTTSAVVISSVTESPTGVYTFVIPSQTSADVLTLTPSKDGFEYSSVIANQILIP